MLCKVNDQLNCAVLVDRHGEVQVIMNGSVEGDGSFSLTQTRAVLDWVTEVIRDYRGYMLIKAYNEDGKGRARRKLFSRVLPTLGFTKSGDVWEKKNKKRFLFF